MDLFHVSEVRNDKTAENNNRSEKRFTGYGYQVGSRE
jgi:hypothetical protein